MVHDWCMIISKAKLNGLKKNLHSTAGFFRDVICYSVREKKSKTLILAFEANNMTSLNCTFLRILEYCTIGRQMQALLRGKK